VSSCIGPIRPVWRVTTKPHRTRFRSFGFLAAGHGMKEAKGMKRFIVRGAWAILYTGIWSASPPSGHTEHVSPRLQSATRRLKRTRFRSFEFVGVDYRMPEAACMTRFSARGPWDTLYADIWSKYPLSARTWGVPAAPSECYHEAAKYPFSLIRVRSSQKWHKISSRHENDHRSEVGGNLAYRYLSKSPP